MFLKRGPGGPDGVVLNMTMLGDGIYNCVYAVPALVGDDQKQFNLQIDTGSSDIWVASTSCTSKPSCSDFSGPKYDSSKAQSTSQTLDLAYQRGSIRGPIVLDTLEVGGYVAKGQAMAAASDVENENLATGSGFSGVIGLALQANSLIAQKVTGSNVDSSTFPTHLFSSSSSPTDHFISLLLERPNYPFIYSRLGLGAHPPLPYSLQTSSIVYSDIMASNPGPLLWRVPVTKIAIDLAGKPVYVGLGATGATGVYSIYPVAIFDSGGTNMIATRALANSIYGTWGVGPGKDDGQYYIPCNLSMNVTLTLGSGASVDVPIHPLDMSNAIQTDPGSATCLGTLQAVDTPMAQGDLILGAAFLRNVYTVMSFDSNAPKLGILPLNNATTALSEFNAIRLQGQKLGDGLSPSQGGSGAGSSAGPISDNKSTGVGLKVLAGVAGFLIIAGLAMFVGVRVLRPRWLRKQQEQAGDSTEISAEMEVSGKEKRLAAGRSMWGMDVEEAFNMFSTGARAKVDSPKDGSDIESFNHPRRSMESDIALQPVTDDEGFLTPGTRMHRRHPPYQSIDSAWGSGSMAGLVKDGRYTSMYSVHSTMNGSDYNLSELAQPVQPTDHYPLPTLHPTDIPKTLEAEHPLQTDQPERHHSPDPEATPRPDSEIVPTDDWRPKAL